MEEDIQQIIEGCKNGNRRAQERLYKNYYKAMASLCIRYTGNEQDAIEILNLGFLKVFRNITTYDQSKGEIYTWIRTIIINTCLDIIKQKTRIQPGIELDESISVYISPDTFQKFNAEEILYLIRQLSPLPQAVFNLYNIEGYSHKEIGKMLGFSEGTSKWYLSNARKALQQLIEKNK